MSCSRGAKKIKAFNVEPAIKAGTIGDAQKKHAPKAVLADYRLGIGDLLLVSVWKDESLTRQVPILPDGTITFPLIGQVNADGMTLAQLKAELTKRLTVYIPGVVLSVQVMQLNSQVVYVIGKVNHPGRLQLIGKINVIQALAMAGGLNAFAKNGKIKIFRNTSKGSRIIPFDYDDVVDGKRLEQNVLLERGDVIVVP
jgi:polysaccharide export outer membrane protein